MSHNYKGILPEVLKSGVTVFYECIYCEDSFPNSDYLLLHKGICPKKPTKTRMHYMCRKCGIFVVRLERHEAKCEYDPYHCAHCHKLFSNKVCGHLHEESCPAKLPVFRCQYSLETGESSNQFESSVLKCNLCNEKVDDPELHKEECSPWDHIEITTSSTRVQRCCRCGFEVPSIIDHIIQCPANKYRCTSCNLSFLTYTRKLNHEKECPFKGHSLEYGKFPQGTLSLNVPTEPLLDPSLIYK